MPEASSTERAGSPPNHRDRRRQRLSAQRPRSPEHDQESRRQIARHVEDVLHRARRRHHAEIVRAQRQRQPILEHVGQIDDDRLARPAVARCRPARLDRERDVLIADRTLVIESDGETASTIVAPTIGTQGKSAIVREVSACNGDRRRWTVPPFTTRPEAGVPSCWQFSPTPAFPPRTTCRPLSRASTDCDEQSDTAVSAGAAREAATEIASPAPPWMVLCDT